MTTGPRLSGDAALRWLPFARADGPHNMAADEILLDATEKGIPSLRFYGWSEATVSLGYFQAADVRVKQAHLAALPWVRRHSGGKTLVHHHELTYALALPAGFGSDWMARMHGKIILPALETLGLGGKVQRAGKTAAVGDVLCFQQQTPDDLVCAGYKIVGSAQRKHRRGLLQHGAILLAQSPHAPELPGLKDLTGIELPLDVLVEAIRKELEKETGWRTHADEWTAAEVQALTNLATTKYASPAWNEKR